ncbi:hypothetical protein [Nakamurella panacisegetis]|uniref:hypothetical protein n=1 Tax=Nakamurella panacisegetis TaxID=1090615 RepID=UPI0012FD579C|nr:hypothetical protein [Nakamurella panacisegetis]
MIAERVGYESKAGVSRAIKSVLDRSDSDEADALRSAHAERIGMGYRTVLEVINRQHPAPTIPAAMDAVEGAKWVDRVAAALEDRAELRLRAVDRLVRLLEREARLHGLDAPVRVQADGDTSISVVFSQALNPMVKELEA